MNDIDVRAHTNQRVLQAIMTAAMLAAAGAGHAQTLGMQPAVAQPQGINLGGTTFVDGFSRMSPGWTYLGTLRYANGDAIKDGGGANVPVFNDPGMKVTTQVNHFSYTSPINVMGAALGFNVLLPVVSIDTHFGQPGAALQGSGTSLGDITLGPSLQFKPVMGPRGPVFVQRLELDVLLPTGKYDEQRDVNQGAGFYSINPYWAATWFPAGGWEVSWRLHYLYNFRNDKPASSAPLAFQGMPVRDTQAGRAAWINFTTSYAIAPGIRAGLNSYYFKQVSDNEINRVSIGNSREQVFGVGPGMVFEVARDGGKRDSLWINTFTESKVRNRTRNSWILQARYAYEF